MSYFVYSFPLLNMYTQQSVDDKNHFLKANHQQRNTTVLLLSQTLNQFRDKRFRLILSLQITKEVTPIFTRIQGHPPCLTNEKLIHAHFVKAPPIIYRALPAITGSRPHVATLTSLQKPNQEILIVLFFKQNLGVLVTAPTKNVSTNRNDCTE